MNKGRILLSFRVWFAVKTETASIPSYSTGGEPVLSWSKEADWVSIFSCVYFTVSKAAALPYLYEPAPRVPANEESALDMRVNNHRNKINRTVTKNYDFRFWVMLRVRCKALVILKAQPIPFALSSEERTVVEVGHYLRCNVLVGFTRYIASSGLIIAVLVIYQPNYSRQVFFITLRHPCLCGISASMHVIFD